MKPALTLFMIALLTACLPLAASAQSVVCVDDSAVGSNDGTSWSDAYRDLQAALDAAEQSEGAITEIWVAAGTYVPSKRADPEDPRSATFAMLNGVSMYGGFAGTENSIDERRILFNATMLSGDFHGDDQPGFMNYDENASHVVTARNLNDQVVLGGFAVSGGNAPSQCGEGGGGGMLVWDACPNIRDCVFRNNFADYGGCTGGPAGARGGGLRIVRHIGSANPCVVELERTTLQENEAVSMGGGLFIRDARVALTNCRVVGNTSEAGGGIAMDGDSVLSLDSCVFDHNTSQYGGGGLYATREYPAQSIPSVTVSGGSFAGNSTAGTGGAIYIPYGRLELERCTFSRNSALSGGALGCEKGADFSCRDCDFTDNTATSTGGAISARSSSEPELVLSGSRFTRNLSETGGAIWFQGATLRLSDSAFDGNVASVAGGAAYMDAWDIVEVLDTTFTENRSESGGAVFAIASYGMTLRRVGFMRNAATLEGGALWSAGYSLVCEGCEFDTNSAAVRGGGFLAWGHVALERCLFRFNSSSNGGAGFWASGRFQAVESSFISNFADLGGAIATGPYADVALDRCTVLRNKAEVGGAIFLGGTDSVLGVTNSLFASNTAVSYGGAIAGGAGEIELRGTTIVGNRAGSFGGGIMLGDSLTMTNSIAWGNVVDPSGEASMDESAQIEGLERAEIAYSDIQGWSGTYGGEGNFDLDPLFVAPDDPDDWWGPLMPDFRLRPESPCINTGSIAVIDGGSWNPPPVNLDLDSKPRVLCQRVDIGAYEFGVAGDEDCDLDFDLVDFSRWDECASGPGEAADCPAFDTDGDGDLDLHDLAGLVVEMDSTP